MGVETFVTRKCLDIRQIAHQGRAVVFHDAHAAEECLDRQAGEETARTASGQDVGRTRDEIADWLGRPWPKEDGAAGGDLFGDFLRILHVDFKMFGRVEIGEFGGLLTRFRLDKEDAVRQNFLDAFRAGKFGGLFGDLRLDFRDKFLVRRNQDGLFTAGAMLRLRQDVRRDIGGIGRLVCQNHDFRRAGDEIESDFAVELALRRRHVGVARTDDFLNFADGLRAIPQGGDGIDAAELVDFRRARDFAGVQNGGIDVAVFRRWRDHNDFLHAGGFRDGDRMDDRRNQRRGAARNVAADAVQRSELLAKRNAFARRERPRLRDALP